MSHIVGRRPPVDSPLHSSPTWSGPATPMQMQRHMSAPPLAAKAEEAARSQELAERNSIDYGDPSVLGQMANTGLFDLPAHIGTEDASTGA